MRGPIRKQGCAHPPIATKGRGSPSGCGERLVALIRCLVLGCLGGPEEAGGGCAAPAARGCAAGRKNRRLCCVCYLLAVPFALLAASSAQTVFLRPIVPAALSLPGEPRQVAPAIEQNTSGRVGADRGQVAPARSEPQNREWSVCAAMKNEVLRTTTLALGLRRRVHDAARIHLRRPSPAMPKLVRPCRQ